MLKLVKIAVVLLLVTSCLNEEGYKLPSTRGTAGLGGVDDHPTGELPPSGNAALVLSVDKSDLSMELAQSQDIKIKLTAGGGFPGGAVNLSVEEALESGGFVKFDFSPSSVTLNPGESQDVTLKVQSCDMAPSFTGKSFKIIASAGNSQLEAREVQIEVLPILTINWTSANVPRTYDKPDNLFLRPHVGGVTVRTRNGLSPDQEQFQGNSPCMHFGQGIHCGFNAIERGQFEEHDKIMPDRGEASTPWYDHFENGDQAVNRRLTFNHEGTNSGTCPTE